MEGNDKKLTYREPKVAEIHEFLEIVRDFTNPRDAIREAISNALDWEAKETTITITEDHSRPDDELVITIQDDGVGLDEERLESFFDLGRSTAVNSENSFVRIGYKGHGTKTYFNCRSLEVLSDSNECSVYAIMDLPLQKLMADEMPKYGYEIEHKKNVKTGTTITIRGYNQNQNKRDFAHNVLLDHVKWFTRFGSIERDFGISDHNDSVLLLQGLGQNEPDTIRFGHEFPPEDCDISKLAQERPGDWTKVFVKCWKFEKRQVIDYPGRTLDFIFYIEGDQAKRSYNPMIRERVRRRQTPYGMYKVEDRYGLWVSKDFIPIKRYNEWLGLGKRLETKYHAFVNCQDFRLTANRGDIGNTPPDFLNAVERTIRQIFEDDIQGSSDYQEYEEAAELEQQYQTAAQELSDFSRRSKRLKTKRISEFGDIELIEPGVEMGVVALFNQIYALKPSLFPFRVVDYDTKRGYDALVAKKTPSDLTKESVFFIEFKYVLGYDFNHSFRHLTTIICWDCRLADGEEVRDIQDKRRKLRITPPADKSDYTHYMLISATEPLNIEIFVLKHYLKEKLGLDFHPRQL